jgi:DNA polymerase-3 subunit delta'
VSADVILGQPIAMKSLRSAIVRDRVAHAYLFVGPDGVGKRLAAKEFAKALNCAEGDSAPCGVCSVCRRIESGVHPDVIETAPGDKARLIKTKVIDDLVDAASGSPLEARRKVFLVIDADRMNLAAANKFLKTLEEPPGASVFILVTARPGMLPVTVVSRCQRVKFSRLPQNVIESILVTKHGVAADEARVAARLSDGRAGRALDFALTERRADALELVGRLMDGADPVALATEVADSAKQRRETVEAEAQKSLRDKRSDVSKPEMDAIVVVETARTAERIRVETNEMLDVLMSWCRDVLIVQTSGDRDLVHNADRMDELEKAARQIDSESISAAIDNLGQAGVLLDANIRLDRILRRAFMPISAVGRSVRETHVHA